MPSIEVELRQCRSGLVSNLRVGSAPFVEPESGRDLSFERMNASTPFADQLRRRLEDCLVRCGWLYVS